MESAVFVYITNKWNKAKRTNEQKKWHEIGASKCVVFAENKNCRAQDGNHMYVSLICENKTEKISNESLIFITHFWVFGVRAVNICPRFLFFSASELVVFFCCSRFAWAFDYFTGAFVCAYVCAYVCISTALPSIRCDYFTVAVCLVCILSSKWTPKWYPEDLLLFDTRIHTASHTHARTHALHISTKQKASNK